MQVFTARCSGPLLLALVGASGACALKGPALTQRAVGCYTVRASEIPAEAYDGTDWELLPEVVALDATPEIEVGAHPMLVPVSWRHQGVHELRATWGNTAGDWRRASNGTVEFLTTGRGFHELQGDSIIVRFIGVTAFLAPTADGYGGIAQGGVRYRREESLWFFTLDLRRTSCVSLPPLVRGAP